MNRRRLFADPAPLPAGSPDFVDRQARIELLHQQKISKQRMRWFDDSSPAFREVERATGNPDVARMLMTRGIRDFEAAETEVRDMLGEMARRGR